MDHIRKLAFIGGGNMASALISGLIQRGLPAARMTAADPSAAQRARLSADYGVTCVEANAAAVQDADVVVLAVKPQFMRAVALGLAPYVGTGAANAATGGQTLVISVAAGILHASLGAWLGGRAAVIRAMPNRPALNGAGATGLYAPEDVAAAQRASAEGIMAAVGSVVWVQHEAQMDTITALSGSGPAYFFLFMEALEAAAHDRGLPRDVAHRLTLQTAFGAAQMARESHESLATLREQVTSRGGTTAAALAVLDEKGLHAMVAQALAAAERRSAELALQFGGAAES